MGARFEPCHDTRLQLAGAGYLAERRSNERLYRLDAPRASAYALRAYGLWPPAICLLWALVSTHAHRQIRVRKPITQHVCTMHKFFLFRF